MFKTFKEFVVYDRFEENATFIGTTTRSMTAPQAQRNEQNPQKQKTRVPNGTEWNRTEWNR
jgi:hypothetical protein